MFDIFQLLVFIVPAYAANAVPVVLGGGAYLDFGAKMPDGERIFGNGKTVKGFVAGVAAGTLVAGLLALYALNVYYSSIQSQFLGGFALSLGTMAGDALGSFVKRRMKIPAGKPFVLDQISFLVVALILTYPFVDKSLYEPLAIIVLFVITYLLHPTTNFIANKAGLKSVPW